MFNNKKGQGLSLNVIIVAALALIVLVVLIMVFTGKMGDFTSGISEEGKSELIKMRINYGTCHPGALAEAGFNLELSKAETTEEKALAKATFVEELNQCNQMSNDKGVCEDSACVWE